MMIAMLLPRFAVVSSIIEFARRGHIFLFESGCVLAVFCVIAYGEMRRCFEYSEVVDGIAMIWLKGFCFLCWIV